MYYSTTGHQIDPHRIDPRRFGGPAIKINPPAYQTPRTRDLSRKEHVWIYRGMDYKCLLCGGVTSRTPPPAPTPDWFTMDRYEPLTREERELIPFVLP